MGAFLGGLLSGYGQHVHEQNLLSEQREQQSRKDLADFYDNLAHQAEVEGQVDHASKLRTYGYQVRSTPIGKKLDKSLTDIRSAMLGPVAQPQEAPPPKAPIQMPGTLLAPPTGQQGLPEPPSGGGGAGPAAGVPPAPAVLGGSQPVTMMPGAAPPSPGFTIPQASLPPPPSAPVPSPAEQGLVMGPDGQWHQSPVGTPELRARREEEKLQRRYGIENAAELRRMTSLAAFNKALEKDTIDERITDLKKEGIWEKLNPQQQTAVRLGAKTVPNVLKPINLPGLISGKDLPPGTMDAFGNPITEGGMYRRRENNGEVEYFPETGRSETKLIEEGGKWFYSTRNQAGHEISRTEAPTPAALRSKTTTSQRIVDIGGQKVALPVTSTTTRGGGAPPGTAASGGGGVRTPAAAPGQAALPRGARVLGESAAAYRQSLPTAATKTMAETAPKVTELADRVLTLIDQQQKQLGPLSSRWQEYMTGKIGAPNPEFAKLRTDVGLLQTLLMRMHVGARGSEKIMEHFHGLIDSSRQSPENLRAALNEIRSYAEAVKQSGLPNQLAPPPSGAALAPPPSARKPLGEIFK